MASPCFQLLYITLAIDKMDGRGLINTARHECLPKKTKVTNVPLRQGYKTSLQPVALIRFISTGHIYDI